MNFLVLLPFFLTCVGMASILLYLCFLSRYVGRNRSRSGDSSEPALTEVTGLSELELQNLPKVTGAELVLGSECVVCLSDIAAGEAVRMIPVCNHGFHLQCGDTWLSKHPCCPICRTKLDPRILRPMR